MNDKRKHYIYNGILDYIIIILLELVATAGFVYVSFTCSLFFIGLVLIGICLIYKNVIKVLALKRKLK